MTNTTDPVLYKLENRVAIVQLNQPETRNAMTPEMGRALVDAIDRASKEAGAIALLGSDKAFCAGANLKSSRMDTPRKELDMGENLQHIFNPLLLSIRDLPIPIVSGISGAAAGVGCSIALMGDIIVAGKSAFFLQAFANVGLVPDGGAAYILSKSVGRVRAMELMLLGERYPAQQAYEDGLITKVVEDNEVTESTIEYATKLAHGPSVALGIIRRSAWKSLDSSFSVQLDRDRRNQKTAGQTEDFQEGVAAFRERRSAKFNGK